MVRFPPGLTLESLRRNHARAAFVSGHAIVDAWLHSRALQSQEKRLSTTRVLVAGQDIVAGFFTLAMGQVDFGDLPPELVRRLPRRALPVAVVAWLGVSVELRGKGLGTLLLAQALVDCHAAAATFPFVAVVLDCVDEQAKAFYQRWDFRELPGRPLRLFLGARALELMVGSGAARPT